MEPADRDNLQMGYNALCSALWNLDRVEAPENVTAICGIFQLVEECRSKLAPIAFPTAFGALDEPELIDGYRYGHFNGYMHWDEDAAAVPAPIDGSADA